MLTAYGSLPWITSWAEYASNASESLWYRSNCGLTTAVLTRWLMPSHITNAVKHSAGNIRVAHHGGVANAAAAAAKPRPYAASPKTSSTTWSDTGPPAAT